MKETQATNVPNAAQTENVLHAPPACTISAHYQRTISEGEKNLTVHDSSEITCEGYPGQVITRSVFSTTKSPVYFALRLVPPQGVKKPEVFATLYPAYWGFRDDTIPENPEAAKTVFRLHLSENGESLPEAEITAGTATGIRLKYEQEEYTNEAGKIARRAKKNAAGEKIPTGETEDWADYRLSIESAISQVFTRYYGLPKETAATRITKADLLAENASLKAAAENAAAAAAAAAILDMRQKLAGMGMSAEQIDAIAPMPA